jgi:hypothetical protein
LQQEHPRHSLELEAAGHWLREITTLNAKEKVDWEGHSPLLVYCDRDDQTISLPGRFKEVAVEMLTERYPRKIYARKVRSRYEQLMRQHLGRLIEDKAKRSYGDAPPEYPNSDYAEELTVLHMYEVLDEIDSADQPDLGSLKDFQASRRSRERAGSEIGEAS